MLQLKQRKIRQQGISLIEIMVSLVVIGVGFIAITQKTGTVIKESADDVSFSGSMMSLSQVINPVYAAAASSPVEFKTEIHKLAAEGVQASANGGKVKYVARVVEAIDDTGLNILTSNKPDTWVSPITVGVAISYQGVSDALGRDAFDMDFGKRSGRLPFTFMLVK